MFIQWDVNGDGYVTAGDAILIINDLNAWGERFLAGEPGPEDMRLDVSGDFVVSVLDAGQVIDYLGGPEGGNYSPPGRNADNPFDANGDEEVDYDDFQAIVDFLAASQTLYPTEALDRVRGFPTRRHPGQCQRAGSTGA